LSLILAQALSTHWAGQSKVEATAPSDADFNQSHSAFKFKLWYAANVFGWG
jgi:hypothetical protein